MENEIMSLALGNGIWAVLFCFLFFYMLKDSRLREKKYTSIIDELTEKLDKIASALSVCEDIKRDEKSVLETSLVVKANTEQIKDDVEALRDRL